MRYAGAERKATSEGKINPPKSCWKLPPEPARSGEEVKVAPTLTEYSTAVTLCRHLLHTEPLAWLISSFSS